MTTNDSKILANNPLILFHRSKKNSEEDLENQKAFLEAHKDQLESIQVIDYLPSSYWRANEMFKLIGDRYSNKKVSVIIQSFLSKEEKDFYYNLYRHIQFLNVLKKAIPIYLMDSDGKLYQEVKDTKKIEWS